MHSFDPSSLSSLVTSQQALSILRDVAGRPRATRCSLKCIVQRGLLTPIEVHPRCFLYDQEQVRAVAAKLAGGAK